MTLTQPEVQMFRKLHSNLISLIFGKFLGGPFFLGTKFPGDQISWGPNFLGTTFLGDQISWGPNFPGTKFLGDQMSWGPNFLGTKKVQGPNFWGPNFSGTKFLGAQKTQGPKWVRGPTQLQPSSKTQWPRALVVHLILSINFYEHTTNIGVNREKPLRNMKKTKPMFYTEFNSVNCMICRTLVTLVVTSKCLR